MTGESHFQKQTLYQNPPTSSNELNRLITLGEMDLDFAELDKSCADLTKLAAKVAGTSISLINLIDSFTQWSVSSYGFDSQQMPREDSVCQYTILKENWGGFEVADLSEDDRFKDKPYVVESPFLKYYFGIPLKINEESSLGALCVLHEEYKYLDAEKKEMLEIIANEVVNRIKISVENSELNRKMQEAHSIKNRVAHDIRGPIGGIVGLAEILQNQGYENKLEEVLEFVGLIQKSGKSVLDLADEILFSSLESGRKPKGHEFTLSSLKNKVLDMFGPQALTKNVVLTIQTATDVAEIPFPKTKILQILGNLISNSIKFTPAGGEVKVVLDMEIQNQEKILKLKVKDNGIGIAPEKVEEIVRGGTASSKGTSGETGFGFGLNLVYHLVSSLNGKIQLKSEPNQGAEFDLTLPVS